MKVLLHVGDTQWSLLKMIFTFLVDMQVLSRNVMVQFDHSIDSQYMNDLWRFSIKESTWKKLNPAGEIPEKRSNHCSVYDPLLKRYCRY